MTVRDVFKAGLGESEGKCSQLADRAERWKCKKDPVKTKRQKTTSGVRGSFSGCALPERAEEGARRRTRRPYTKRKGGEEMRECIQELWRGRERTGVYTRLVDGNCPVITGKRGDAGKQCKPHI